MEVVMSKSGRYLGIPLALAIGAASAFAAEPDWKSVDQAFGVAGVPQPDGAQRYNFPRRDLDVTLDGVKVKPGLALGSWLAFKPMANGVMVMGDLVLTSEEVTPVMKKLESEGIEITALHNHLLRSSPMTMYMHVGAHGDPVQLAKEFKAALSESKTPFGPAPAAAQEPESAVKIADLDAALHAKGKDNNGIYQYSFPRAEALKAGGMALTASSGTATSINFQPTDGGKAAITGDFVLIGSEVNPVIAALEKSGIEVTAVHNHMLDDEPRLFFMHFWANDNADKLAKGLREALDKVNLKK
jgi:biotin operon repressor